MKVLLTESIASLGKKGEVKEVSEGYARNFLLPRKIAVPATQKAVSDERTLAMRRNQKLQKTENNAKKILKKIDQKLFSVKTSAAKSGTLFAAVTKADIVAHLRRKGYDIHERMVVLSAPIKHLGTHRVDVFLGATLKATIIIEVKPID